MPVRTDYKAVTCGLKVVYQAMALDAFAEIRDERYPQTSQSWRAHGENLNTRFSYPPDLRKAVYTTNAIESLNSMLRTVIKTQSVSNG